MTAERSGLARFAPGAILLSVLLRFEAHSLPLPRRSIRSMSRRCWSSFSF